jgi:hypothetical protein
LRHLPELRRQPRLQLILVAAVYDRCYPAVSFPKLLDYNILLHMSQDFLSKFWY